jgi:hypothetical protein
MNIAKPVEPFKLKGCILIALDCMVGMAWLGLIGAYCM